MAEKNAVPFSRKTRNDGVGIFWTEPVTQESYGKQLAKGEEADKPTEEPMSANKRKGPERAVVRTKRRCSPFMPSSNSPPPPPPSPPSEQSEKETDKTAAEDITKMNGGHANPDFDPVAIMMGLMDVTDD